MQWSPMVSTEHQRLTPPIPIHIALSRTHTHTHTKKSKKAKHPEDYSPITCADKILCSPPARLLARSLSITHAHAHTHTRSHTHLFPPASRQSRTVVGKEGGAGKKVLQERAIFPSSINVAFSTHSALCEISSHLQSQ